MTDLNDLQSDVPPETTRNQEHSEDVCETRSEINGCEELSDLHKRNIMLEEENNHLKTKCKTMKIELEEKKKMVETKDNQLAKKEEEVAHYANRLASLEMNYSGEKQSIEKRLELSNERLARERQKRKDLNDVYTDIVKEKNVEIWALKRIKQHRKEELERKIEELSTRLSQEEWKTKSLRREAKKSQCDLKDYLIKLSKEEALCKSLQEANRKLEASYETLREEYNNYVKETAMETGQMVNNYQILRDGYEKYIKDKKEETEQILSCLTRKHNELTILQTELADTKSRLTNVQKELRDSKTRLASVLQKRLLVDQRRVENTVEFNTPSDLERDFRDFFAGDRLDAVDIIDNAISFTEDSDLHARYLAFLIFVTAYEEVEEAKEASRDLLNSVTRQLILDTPRRSQELCDKRKGNGPCPELSVAFNISVDKVESEDPVDSIESLMLSLKNTAHICDIGCFENTVKKAVLERWMKCLQEKNEMSLLPEPSEEVISELEYYIKACIRLSWRLVTQLPPLQLEYNCLMFNKQKHRITRPFYNLESTDSNPSDSIACYLWPALLELGGRVIYPAEVICMPASY